LNIENGIYLITDKGKEVMIKCSKGHCYKMTDEHVEDIHAFDIDGMFVFEDRVDQDQPLMDDGILNDLTGILSKSLTLNSCVKGECKKTFGFIRYNSGNSVAKYNPSVVQKIFIDSFVECSIEGNNEANRVISNMDLCLAPGISKAITGVGLIFIQNVDNKNLYQRTEANVAGAALNGNYLVNDVIEVCNNNNCVTNNIDGYFVNYDHYTNSEYPLIYCKGDGTECSLVKLPGQGYYWNGVSHNKYYIVCDKDGCRERNDDIAIDEKPCNSNNYNVVYNTGEPQTFKYCDGDTGVGIANTATLTYYYVEGKFLPGDKFNYPTEMKNTDDDSRNEQRTVIVKTEAYSVTVVDEADLPIGYLKTGDGYIKCEFNKEGKKVCSKVTVDKTACEAIGELFKTGSVTYNLCIDPTEGSTVSLDLTTDGNADNAIDSTGQYVIAIGEGLFGINKINDGMSYYVVVEVDELGNVTVVKEPKAIKYRYTDTDSTQHRYTLYKIYGGAEVNSETEAGEICDATGGPGKPFEFEYVQWSLSSGANQAVDYYKEGGNSDLTA